MSWIDFDILLTSVLQGNGYAEIPENKIPEASASNFKHKGYSLKPVGFGGIAYLANDGFEYQNKCRIEIGYANKTPQKRDENFAEFTQLMLQIVRLSDFNSLASDPSFEDYGDSIHTKGVIEIFIGVECTC